MSDEQRVLFVLYHQSEYPDSTLLIGVFDARKTARDAIRRLVKQPGFSDAPDGFYLAEYALNKVYISEGVARVPDEARVPLED